MFDKYRKEEIKIIFEFYLKLDAQLLLICVLLAVAFGVQHGFIIGLKFYLYLVLLIQVILFILVLSRIFRMQKKIGNGK
ncbi:MAG: hypothetical protein OEW08_13275 [Gammaproteobacteria bacterium]|nr:hypothetical protein [Gammaproteobacteria bacterium]